MFFEGEGNLVESEPELDLLKATGYDLIVVPDSYQGFRMERPYHQNALEQLIESIKAKQVTVDRRSQRRNPPFPPDFPAAEIFPYQIMFRTEFFACTDSFLKSLFVGELCTTTPGLLFWKISFLPLALMLYHSSIQLCITYGDVI